MDKLRAEFERRFPVPDNICWIGDRGVYVLKYEPQLDPGTLYLYRAKWEGYQACAESLRAELETLRAANAKLRGALEPLVDYLGDIETNPSLDIPDEIWVPVEKALDDTEALSGEAVTESSEFDAEHWAELYRLRSVLKGPGEFNTWQDAAIHERRLRVAAEKKLGEAVPMQQD